MPEIVLKYGQTAMPFEYDDGRFCVLGGALSRRALSDNEIGEKLDNPIDSPPIDTIVAPGDTILIVVPDATRETASGQIVNLIVRRLIANGTAPNEIRIIFATGIHRKVTAHEKGVILTPFIAQRIKTIDHDPRDLMQIVRVGETAGGIPIELNRAIFEHDHVFIVGGVNFHYFAGFTGGRKLICPGLASARTISATHKLAFDCENMRRREGVGTGSLAGNAVHEAFTEIVSKAPPVFSINTIVNDDGAAADIFCGDWLASHEVACRAFAEDHTIFITEKRDLVIVSCAGYPHDINLIQAHKALDAAAAACKDGGTILLLAECKDGLGRNDLLDWFDASDSGELAKTLCGKYKVNGQTAWSLLQKAEKFDIRLLTELADDELKKMRLGKIDIAGLRALLKDSDGYIIPIGSKINVKMERLS